MQLIDETLNQIPEQGGNVAQFVSFAPNGTQRFHRIRGVPSSKIFPNVEQAITSILQTGTPYLNIRAFIPNDQTRNIFYMGRNCFDTKDSIISKVHELMAKGYYIIVNEEIDIYDGGFSGVLLGNIAEFATRDTPRCVEKSGCATLSRFHLTRFASIVYGHTINIPYDRSYRVEFSVHPGPVGYCSQHQIIWQVEKQNTITYHEPTPRWPNRVSEDMGDKVYGLLIAHLYNFLVPRTKVVGRFIPPFEFGVKTTSPEQCWRRICPKTQQPGLFTSKRGQIDPFALIQREDPNSTEISSIIFQDDIEALYSGATITDVQGNPIIEGKQGRGDNFMIGREAPEKVLPEHIKDSVLNIWEKAVAIFGHIRFEWCYDKTGTVWIVQLHVGGSDSTGSVIYPGNPKKFVTFEVSRGLENLRSLVEQVKHEDCGIILKGNVGITSHFGDVLRRSQIPSRLELV